MAGALGLLQPRLRKLLGLRAGDRLARNLELDGLHLVPQGQGKTLSDQALIGCVGDRGETVPLERMDPALYAQKV